jgi:hypothetical protein
MKSESKNFVSESDDGKKVKNFFSVDIDSSSLPTTYQSIPSVDDMENTVDLEKQGRSSDSDKANEEKKLKVTVAAFIIGSVILLLAAITLYVSGDTLPKEGFTFERGYYFMGLEGIPLSSMHVYHYEGTDTYEVKGAGINPRLGANHPRGALAVATYKQTVGKSGWNYLSVRSTMPPDLGSDEYDHHVTREEVLNDYLVSKLAMGYLEGHVTCPQIQDWYRNFYQGMFDGGDPKMETLDFLETNHDWMMEQANLHWRDSEYWLTVRGTLAQLHGMLAGIRASCPGIDDLARVEEDLSALKKRTHVLPESGGKRVADFDGANNWRSSHSGGEDDDEVDSDKPSFRNGIYLPSIHRRPSLIHLLLLNANGDLYQIASKYNQGTAPPYVDDDEDDRGRRQGETYIDPTSDKTSAASQQPQSYNEELLLEDPAPPLVRAHGEIVQEGLPFSVLDQLNLFDPASGDHLLLSSPPQQLTAKQLAISEMGKGSTVHPPSHCSSLIKLLPDNSDVYFGHSTWDDYQCAAPRIFKTFEYPLIKDGRPDGWYVTHFSSSPGMLSSVDDFYINRGRFFSTVIETSLDIYKNELLDRVQPLSTLSWVRVVVSNYLAEDGNTWSAHFAQHASGTYVNQWMVLDMSKFSMKDTKPPQPGFLTVLEEMPGLIHWEDMTQKLIEDGHWASFNNPYFADIAKISGQDDLCLKDINQCYASDPRKLIFAREEETVTDLESFQEVIAFNKFQHDPLSQNNSCFAIMCRGDLQPNISMQYPYGGIDAKVSSFRLAVTGGTDEPPENDYDPDRFESIVIPEVYSRLGPTHDDQTPFCWSKYAHTRDKSTWGLDKREKPFNHFGHPDCFDFEWEQLPMPHEKRSGHMNRHTEPQEGPPPQKEYQHLK